jgi:hypothetical protein
MSYGYYSEIYFAESVETSVGIKIGETTNARRRSNKLFQERNYWVTDSLEVGGDDARRLFIESYLRLKIAQNYPAQRIGKDYFVCRDAETAQAIKRHFREWVIDALALSKEL